MITNLFNKKSLTIITGVILIALAGVFSLRAEEEATTNPNISVVESKYVCMVNNKLFQDEQIPVEVDGKTYYGCCEMCKAKLEKNLQSRYSIDPVSGVKVDKSTSVIGATKTGKVYYFESKANLIKFEN